ncbi:hypothetical protein J5277_16430 [Rhizobium sp. 16-449-1b]|uniref:hypothetical protein n=1 Tax=Rhizobium sp. 16-449-1b TaxID=2819989 RepID=UPI001AD9FAC7|nr:hypothetical protein [Rhizobium sp. 16-449-1b]MBO9195694.1 hypothetical protein [Rhizobium sp. 16-449-1b]
MTGNITTDADIAQTLRMFDAIIPELTGGVADLFIRARALLEADLPNIHRQMGGYRGELLRELADRCYPGWRLGRPCDPSARRIALELCSAAKKIKINEEYFSHLETTLKRIMETNGGEMPSFETVRRHLR